MALRLVFASIVSARHFSEMHTALGADDRLLSYAELLFAPPEFLPHYVTTGLHPPKMEGRRTRDENWDSPVPRVVKKHIGKEKPDKKHVRKSVKHWHRSVYVKKRRLALIEKAAAYAKEDLDE